MEYYLFGTINRFKRFNLKIINKRTQLLLISKEINTLDLFINKDYVPVASEK
jgi:hypothetical protein